MLYKRNSRTFKHLDQKSAVFQGFQGLEKPVMNFKYFQALQGPVRTLSELANDTETKDSDSWFFVGISHKNDALKNMHLHQQLNILNTTTF